VNVTEIVLPRTGKTDLRFSGEQLGHVSSHRSGAGRWSGEHDIFWADTLTSADDVIRRLTRHDAKGVAYLTILALALLREAAPLDASVEQALVAHG